MTNPSYNPQITIATAVYKVQSHLIETPSTPFDLLLAASTLLSKPGYDDVVTERTISDLCGNPRCPNPLPSPKKRHRKGRYRVSLSEHKVYDLQETYKYCCEECLIGSRAYKSSLSDERRADIDVKKGKLEEVLRLFGYLDGEREEKGAPNSKLEIKERGYIKVGDVKLDEWIGASNAIEGYVPQHDRGSKIASNLESMQGTKSARSTTVEYKSKNDGDNIDGVFSKEYLAETDDVSEMIARKLEDVVITEKEKSNKRSSKSSKFGVFSKEYLAETDDVSEMIARKLEDVVITEKEKSNKRSSKSSKFESRKVATNSNIDRVDYSDVSFTSNIIYNENFDPALPKTCDVSELIAKQLEDVVITEKKVAKFKSSKSPRSASRRKASNDKCDRMDIHSSEITGGSSNVAPKTPVSSLDSAKVPANVSGDDIQVKNKTELIGYNELDDVLCLEGVKKKEVSQKTGLKSSLKSSRSMGGNRSVKWADEIHSEAQGDKVMQEEELESSLRLASVEACAAALYQAAESVALGEAEVGDAVSEAGIVILPQPQYGDSWDSKAAAEAFEFDQEVLKWPKKTVLLDTDMFDVEDSWHDTPPEGFSLTLSSFATMWMALFGWITCSSLAYIYGRDESLQEDFLFVNGREYPRKIYLREGKSSEIRQALDGFMCRALPGLVIQFRLPTPVSTLEKFLARFLDTMSFVDALPSFKMKQWQVIVLLFIEALSVHRLPSLAPQMTSTNMLLHKMLNAAQISSDEYETMRDLVMPLGRVPQLSMQNGG